MNTWRWKYRTEYRWARVVHPRAFAIVFSLFFGTLFGQQLQIIRYTTEDGLAHDIGYEILQDRKGYIWIGTDNGLSRFDGARFKNYTVEDGMASPYIITVSEGPDGAIWAGAYRNGINKVQEDTIIHYRMPSGTLQWKAIFSGNEGLLFDRHSSSALQYFISFREIKGNLEVLDSIFVFNFKNLFFSRLGEQWTKKIEISNVLPAREPDQLFGISNIGVINFSIQQGSIVINKVFLPSGRPFNLFQGDEENLFVLCENEIIELTRDLERVSAQPLPPGNYRQLARNQKGQFVVTRKDGFALLYPINGKYVDIYPRLNITTPVSQIYIDKQDRLWVTTAGDGLFMVDWSYVWNYSKEQGLKNPFVKHIRKGPSGAVFAGSSTAIYRLSGEKWVDVLNEERYQNTGSVGAFERFFPIEDKGVIIFTSSQLYMIDEEGYRPFSGPVTNQKSHLPSDDGMYFFQRKEGAVIFHYASHEEISSSSPAENKKIFRSIRINDSLFFRHPSIVTMDSKNRIWVGTSNGVLLYWNNKVRRFTEEDGLPDHFVNEIVEDSLGRIWIGTIRGACFLESKRDGDWTFSPVRVQGDVQSIVFASSQAIWLGTRTGLVYYNLELDRQRLFTEESGLASSYINDLLIDKQRKLWIATKYGISMMDLTVPVPAISPPVLYVEKVAVNKKKATLSFPLSLAHDDQFDIFYSVVVPPKPNRVLFSYRLGPRDSWKETEEDHLSFSALKPGSYEFTIRARTGDSDWSPERRILFYMNPPWYQKWWAYLGYFLLGGLALFFLFSRVRRQAVRNMEINQRLARMELRALQAQINPHFLFNTLNSIQHLFYRSDVLTTNRYFSSFAKLMRHFLDSSRELETTLTKEVNQLRLYLELEKLRFEDQFSYSLDVDIQSDPNETMIPTMVIQPFVENAINHGLLPKKGVGMLKVQIRQEGNWIICTIEDNGIGRVQARENKKKNENNHKSQGMALVYERLEVLNQIRPEEIFLSIADKKTEREETAGTLVDIKMPIINMQE